MNNTITKRVAVGTSIAALALFGAVTYAHSIKKDDVVNLNTDLESAVATALAAQPGDVIEVELEIERKRSIWEVEIVDDASRIYEIEIDGATGEVLETEIEDDAAPDMSAVTGLNSVIETVRTVTDGTLIEIELEAEDESLHWEVKSIGEDGRKTKHRVHAKTGEIQS